MPITGFANAVVSPAIDFKSEGFITGMASKMFTVAGADFLRFYFTKIRRRHEFPAGGWKPSRQYRPGYGILEPKDCALAFVIGGGICVVGQLITDGYTALGLDKTDAGTLRAFMSSKPLSQRLPTAVNPFSAHCWPIKQEI